MLAAMAPTARLMASCKPEGDCQGDQAIQELQYISVHYKVQTKQSVFRSLKRGTKKELFPLAFLKFFARRVSSSSEAASPRAFEASRAVSVFQFFCF